MSNSSTSYMSSRRRRGKLFVCCRTRTSDRDLYILALAVCLTSLVASQWAFHQAQKHQPYDETPLLHTTRHPNDMIMISRSGLHAAKSSQKQHRHHKMEPLLLDLEAPPDLDSAAISLTKTDNSAADNLPVDHPKDQQLDLSAIRNMLNHSHKFQHHVAKRQKQEPLPEPPATIVWNQKKIQSVAESFPIFNMGLPRSGSDTMAYFFQNLGYETQLGCGDLKRPRENCIAMGNYMYENWKNGRPILHELEFQQLDERKEQQDAKGKNLQVYTQFDSPRLVIPFKPLITGQVMPQVTMLKEIYDYNPNATWVLPLRDPEHFAYSISRHHTLRLRIWNEHFVQKHNLSFPVSERKYFEPQPEEIETWQFFVDYYRNHTDRVRQFAKAHPSLRLIEWNYTNSRAPTDLLFSLQLPIPESSMNWTSLWECQPNECDFWDKEVKMIKHFQSTPKPKLKLPTPIFVVGFPKSGTTSVYNFFSCAGVQSQHYCCCGDVSDHRPCFTDIMAQCILENIKNKKPMLKDCGEHYQLYAQIDGEHAFVWKDDDGNQIDRKAAHFLPQIHNLDLIHDEFPNATFILPLREAQVWAESVGRWFNMRHRLLNEYSVLNWTIPDEKKPLVSLYEAHTQNVIDFVRRHPSHKLIKFHITQPDAGQILSEAFGLPVSCWGHHNKNSENKK